MSDFVLIAPVSPMVPTYEIPPGDIVAAARRAGVTAWSSQTVERLPGPVDLGRDYPLLPADFSCIRVVLHDAH